MTTEPGRIATVELASQHHGLMHEMQRYYTAQTTARLQLLQPVQCSNLYYSAPDRGAEYCDERVCARVCVRVCVSVCLSVGDHIFGTTRPIFTNFFAHLTYRCGSVLFRRRSDTLCTSGFMDDAIFAHKPRLLDVAAHVKRSAHAALGLAINTDGRIALCQNTP